MSRSKPYTERGIRRVPCSRCGSPSWAQWHVCADGNRPRGICRPCDVALNEMTMRFFFADTRESDLAAYRGRVLREA